MTNRSVRRVVALAIVVAVLAASFLPSGPGGTTGGSVSVSRNGVSLPLVLPASSAPAPSAGADIEVAPAFSPSPGVVTVGPAPAQLPITVEVGLAPPAPSALAGLVSALYTPGTPEYHQFLSSSELAERFGPSLSSVTTAQAYFERFGLSARPSPDRLLLTVTGPSASIGAAFGTTFEVYRAADGRTFVSHPSPAALPSIAPWSGVVGLGNVTPIVPAAEGPFSLGTALTPGANCSGSATGLVPCQVWEAYDMTSLIAGGTNGSGVRLAVVDPYSSGEPQSDLTSDLATFANDTQIPVGTVNYVYPDIPPRNLNVSTNTGWNLEDALDLEWARAAAPGATIDMTFSPDAGAGLFEAVDWLVAHQAANVISLSWGEPDVGVFDAFSVFCYFACNASTDGSYGILAPVLSFAAAEGISVFAASGDCGAADGTSGVSTNYPSSDPDVTGVGGTVLTVNASGGYVSETGWSGNETGAQAPGCMNTGGSGGGYSPFPRPAWQTGLPTHTTGRGVPDVALDAGSAASVVFRGQAVGAIGTSLSTPIWAGIAAIADQFAGTPLGLLNPSLYAIAAGSNYSLDFHDITSGNNGYPAGTGWDPVTGLGSPRVANLVIGLAHPVSVSWSTLASFLYASPRFGSAPLTVHFHLNVTGGTGVYPLEGIVFGDGSASFAPGGNMTYTYENPGVYAPQAYVADPTANYSVSPPLAIVVGGGRALSVTLDASTDAPAVGGSVLFTVKGAGGTAPYEYNFSFGDGTFLYDSRNSSTSHIYGARGSFCASVVVSDSALPTDGAASGRVAIGAGGAALPDCRNDTLPLLLSSNPNIGVQDAPADFQNLSARLFSVTGGSTTAGTLPASIDVTSTDPYLAACNCTIFRSPGVYPVTAYASDSENEEATATVDVTVTPPLVGTFTATPTYGVAPLNVTFRANATGGYGADAANTVWTFENGPSVGATVSYTFSRPGLYIVLGHLSDRGQGNASKAFLIDVAAPPGSPLFQPPYLFATISPALDVPLGASVNFTAGMIAANGSSLPSSILWKIGSESGGFEPSLNWTYAAPLPNATEGVLNVTVIGRDLAADRPLGLVPVEDVFRLADFGATEANGFQPRVDALNLTDYGGPQGGSAPLVWNGVANVSGPGGTSIVWSFGPGIEGNMPGEEFAFGAGLHTVVLTVLDGWGDSATDVFPAAAFAPLGFGASLSTTSGAAPLTVAFRANATGGYGPPYQYNWSFGDGQGADIENTTHLFASAGSYTVTLTVIDPYGDSSTMQWTVTVTPAWTAFAPMIFLGVGIAVGAGATLAAAASRRRSAGRTASP